MTDDTGSGAPLGAASDALPDALPDDGGDDVVGDAVTGEAPAGDAGSLAAVAQRLTDVPTDLPARAALLDGVLATLQADLARLDHV